MSATIVHPPHASDAAPSGEKIFRVGTLQYRQKDLYVLFVWLMWNEFTMMLLQDPQGFGGYLQKDFGATNEQIAAELVLSLSAVKGHLRILFSRFGLEEAAQNQKRLRLAERALATGAVAPDELQ